MWLLLGAAAAGRRGATEGAKAWRMGGGAVGAAAPCWAFAPGRLLSAPADAPPGWTAANAARKTSGEGSEGDRVRGDLRKFVDRLRVVARGGAGGAGAVSIWKSKTRGKFLPADGGNGGGGGAVIFEACPDMRCLKGVRQTQIAPKGGRGGGQKVQGARGRDLIVRVPVGTVVSRLVPPPQDDGVWSDDEEEEEGTDGEDKDEEWPPPRPERVYAPVGDLSTPGTRLKVAEGGKGGRGNASYRTRPNRPASREHETGEPGEEIDLLLELKSIADVGLVGMPNAGKSTLLGALSRADPVVGAYAFTTLRPQLGVVHLPPESPGKLPRQLTVADIPGLIEGARDNRGLGHRFLRHVERTQVLAYIVDIGAGLADDQPRPWDQVRILQEELEAYKPGLAGRPSLCIANKIDTPGTSRTLAALRKRLAPMEVVPVSALGQEGLEELKEAFGDRVVLQEAQAHAVSQGEEVSLEWSDDEDEGMRQDGGRSAK